MLDGELPDVLPLGDPRLRMKSLPVTDVLDPSFAAENQRLHSVLRSFRARFAFGRAIAAPQIGILKRFIALHLDGHSNTLINPDITNRSEETFTMWDDCMSFPYLLVKVRRHRSIQIRYINLQGELCEWNVFDRATSELLQHEIDHLDGVLAIDRAIDREGIISREAFAAASSDFKSQVDYAIGMSTQTSF